MAIDLDLKAAIQAKINNVTPATPISDIVALERAASSFGTTYVYDSAGQLPLDPYYEGSILATKGSNIYQNNAIHIMKDGTWGQLQELNEDPIPLQGETAGFVSGGYQPSTNAIVRYNFSSDTPDVTTPYGTGGGRGAAGASSATHGYALGGPIFLQAQKFSFTASSTIETLVSLDPSLGGQAPDTHGLTNSYEQSGYMISRDPVALAFNKISFTTDVWSSSLHNQTPGKPSSIIDNGACMNFENGYLVGGTPEPSPYNVSIHKFPFASEGAITVAISPLTRFFGTSTTSSETKGYTMGGYSGKIAGGGGVVSTGRNFPFASETLTTQQNNLSVSQRNAEGFQSKTDGFNIGGLIFVPGPSVQYQSAVEKYPFANTTAATDLGDIFGEPVMLATGYQF